jgi:hypothetical protein
LSEWIMRGRADPLWPENREALEAVGTNAIPFYLKWLGYDPSIFRKGVLYMAAFSENKLGVHWRPYAGVERTLHVPFGFSVLGAEGQAAIPQLAWFATNSTSESIRLGAVSCLAEIGPPSIPTLLMLMTNESPRIRGLAVEKACRFGRDKAIIAQTVVMLQDLDGKVRRSATNSLDWIDGNQTAVIPFGAQ